MRGYPSVSIHIKILGDGDGLNFRPGSEGRVERVEKGTAVVRVAAPGVLAV